MIEPVYLEQVRRCQFQPKPCALCGKPKSNAAHTPKKSATCKGKWPRGCNRCGENKGDWVHYGQPPSFNVLASGQGSGNAMVYAGHKDKWQAIFLAALQASDLPLGLGGVSVEGEITFPDARADRDQGNFRVIIEKALGDALQQGGYIERDDWTRYEFGQLTQRVQPGESATRLVIFPRERPTPPRRDQLELEGAA